MENRKNFFTDNEEIDFYLSKKIDLGKIFAWLSDAEKEAVDAKSPEEYKAAWFQVLNTLGEITGSEIAPNGRKVDEEHLGLTPEGDFIVPPTLAENLKVIKDFGVGALGTSAEWGGLGAPFAVEVAASEMLNRACPSTALNVCWYSSTAHIVDLFGTDRERQMVIPGALASELSGSMALTEADAGSDVAAFRTYGEEQADGTWKLFGSKRFITNACGDYSLVLGKNSKNAPGLENLNLYLCFRKENGKVNYEVGRLEEKLGLKGSPTCEMTFDGSKAYLLGKDGEGFRYMLQLMNDARIAVAIQAIGIMEASLRLAKEYAAERKTWGKPIAHHEMIAEKILDMEVELAGLRSISYQSAYYRSLISAGEKYLKNQQVSEEKREEIEKELGVYKKRLRRWTPLIKWWGGEKSQEHARTGLMIHGGYGFTKEYRAEFWYRESAVLAIYEGTSQIQSLMALKDTVKEVIRNPQKFIENVLGLKMKSLAETDSRRKLLLNIRQLYQSSILSLMLKMLKSNMAASFSTNKTADIRKLIKVMSKDIKRFDNMRLAFLHAEKLCEIKSWTCIAESLYFDMQTDASRAWIFDRFAYKAIARIQCLKSMIETDEPVINARLDSYEKAVPPTAKASSDHA